MDTAIIAAIAAAAGSLLTGFGKVIVDIIRAKKEPDQSDLELKDELNREKDKSNKAISDFTEVAKELKQSIEDLNTGLNSRFEDMNNRIEDMNNQMNAYRDETREINKSELRHSITQIYYDNCKAKTFNFNTKKDVCSLYEAYTSIGGNSFVHELYEEMMNWDVT